MTPVEIQRTPRLSGQCGVRGYYFYRRDALNRSGRTSLAEGTEFIDDLLAQRMGVLSRLHV